MKTVNKISKSKFFKKFHFWLTILFFGITTTAMASLLFVMTSPADPIDPFHPYQAISDLESKLQQTWTKQQYVDAYLNSNFYNQVEGYIALREDQKSPLGQFHFAWVEAAAALYAETKNTNYLGLVKRALLHETAYPSTDLQFTLSRITHSYELVRADLDAALSVADIQGIETMITNHAHTCLSMESGTEMNRGIMNMLGLIRTAELYPNAAESSVWMATAVNNWTNGFLRMKDTNEDVTSYNALWVYNMVMVAEKLETNTVTFYQQPWVKDLFERYLNIRLPQGVEPMTYTHDGFIEYNMALYEWAGKIYQDGRYRWAAQRMLNFLRAQPGSSNMVPREPVFLYTDDDITPEPPTKLSYYSHHRYDREYPNKFVLRSGYGEDATALAMNLFHGGGHGHAEGSSIYGLMDQYGVLLSGREREEGSDEYGNVVLLRKGSDPFPFGATDPEEWHRVHLGLLAANTALGGLNINLASVTTIGLRYDATNPSAGDVSIRNVRVGGTNGTTTLFSGETNYAATEMWMNFPVSTPLDLSGDEYLEFEWKYDADTAPGNPTVYINGSNPSAASRYVSYLLHNWRDSQVRFYGDYDAVHMASVEVDLYGYDGGNHKQYRDIFMLPNELIWVRDTFEFGADGDYQVGPLWHVGDVASSGTGWFQTRTYSTTIYNGEWVEVGEPRDLLIVMPEQAGCTNGITTYNPDSKSRRPYTVYQKWSGTANEGDKVVFNSFLIPNQSSTPSTLAANVQLIESNDFAQASYNDWVLVDNPDAETVDLPEGLTTTKRMTALQEDAFGYVSRTYELDFPGSGGMMIEAENYENHNDTFSPFEVVDSENDDSSNDRYIRQSYGTTNNGDGMPDPEDPSTPDTGYADYGFELLDSQSVDIWIRARAADDGQLITQNDSFWLDITNDGTDPKLWHYKITSTNWAWYRVYDDVNLSAGQYIFRVGYREDGTLLDKIYLTFDDDEPAEGLVYEAEDYVNSAAEFSPMEVVTNASDGASRDAYIRQGYGTSNNGDGMPDPNDPDTPDSGFADYSFDLSSAESVDIWIRARAADDGQLITQNDSFWLDITNDGTDPKLWHYHMTSTNWAWYRVYNDVSLSQGSYDFRVGYREDGTLLDKIFITPYGDQPAY